MRTMVGFPWYVLGDVLHGRKKLAGAERAFRRAIRIKPDHPLWNARVAAILLHKKAFQEGLHFYDKAVRFAPNVAAWHFGRGKCLFELKRNAEAVAAFEVAIQLAPRNAPYYDRLAAVLRKQGKTWQEAEMLRKAVELAPHNANLYFRLGESLEAMDKPIEAVDAYKAAVALKSGRADWFFKLGRAAKQAGDVEACESAFKKAIQADKTLNAKRFGIGVFYQQSENWRLAAIFFTNYALEKPYDSELHYRLGMAHDRNYEWEQAERAYRIAIGLNFENAEYHYRLGFVCERMDRWEDSASAYKLAIQSSKKHQRYWQYRLGYVLSQAGNFQDASDAFLLTEPSYSMVDEDIDHYKRTAASEARDALLQNFDQTDARLWVAIAELFAKVHDWESETQAWSRAIDRSSDPSPFLYFRLGASLHRQGRFEEACLQFRSTRIIQHAIGFDTSKLEADKGFSRVADYVEHLENLPIRENVVLYESNLGGSISCNPLAICEKLLSDPRHADLLHVWSVVTPEQVPDALKMHPNVVFVERESANFLRYLATAKYLINNSTFPPYFVRREEQQYLNTWHGTPLKAMGTDISIPSEFMSHCNTARNLLQASHVISPNNHTSKILMERNDIAGVFSGKIAETGYPRVDRCLNATPARKTDIKRSLNLDVDKPVVLYVPTWRGAMANVEIDQGRLLSDIKMMGSPEHNLVFRGHHYSEKALAGFSLPVTVAPPTMDTYDLLAIADVIVTDYSSIFFDYLATRRPIIYYVYDLDQYVDARGKLYFDQKALPGTFCSDQEGLLKAIPACIANQEDKSPERDDAIQKFASLDDGRATERVIEFFFHGDDSGIVSSYQAHRKNILIQAGDMKPNGITASFLNLVNALDKTKYNISVVVDPAAVKSNPASLDKFRAIPSGVHKIGRVGRHSLSYEDHWIRRQVEATRAKPSDRLFSRYVASGEREFVRLFGRGTWSCKILFDGYGRFWPSVFAGSSQVSGKRRIIYLHNDMFEEHLLRFPSLRTLFHLYDQFDELVSVSETMAGINSAKLSVEYPIPSKKFNFCQNIIDGESILLRAEHPLDQDLISFSSGRITFLNVARISPEKDQIKLLRAFKMVADGRRDVCLIVLGDGPYRPAVERTVIELGLQKSVLLAGLRSNPYPMLKAADCFVLSSNHEGQPMVLLESLVLNKPIIATDIDGNRGALGDKHGMLVHNNVDGLADGMRAFLDGNVKSSSFDYVAYNKYALDKFEKIMIGESDDLALPPGGR